MAGQHVRDVVAVGRVQVERHVERVVIDLPNALVYRAEPFNAGTEKPLLLIWYLENLNLHLVVCTTE